MASEAAGGDPQAQVDPIVIANEPELKYWHANIISIRIPRGIINGFHRGADKRIVPHPGTQQLLVVQKSGPANGGDKPTDSPYIGFFVHGAEDPGYDSQGVLQVTLKGGWVDQSHLKNHPSWFLTQTETLVLRKEEWVPIEAVCITESDMKDVKTTLRSLIPAVLQQPGSTQPPGQKHPGDGCDGDGTSKKTKNRSARERLRLPPISVVNERIDNLKAQGKWGPAQQQSLQRYFAGILAHANPTPKRPRETPAVDGAAAAPETGDAALPEAVEPRVTRRRMWEHTTQLEGDDGAPTLGNCLQKVLGNIPGAQPTLRRVQSITDVVDKIVVTMVVFRLVRRNELNKPNAIDKMCDENGASFRAFVRTQDVEKLWSTDPCQVIDMALVFNHAEKREVVPQCYVSNRPRWTTFTPKNAKRTLGKMGLESTECDFAGLQRRFNETASSQGWNTRTPLGTPFEQCVIILELLEAKAGEPPRCGLFVVYQICTDKDKLDRYMKDQKKANITATVDCWDLEYDWTSYTTNKMACDVFLDQPRTFKVVTRKGA